MSLQLESAALLQDSQSARPEMSEKNQRVEASTNGMRSPCAAADALNANPSNTAIASLAWRFKARLALSHPITSRRHCRPCARRPDRELEATRHNLSDDQQRASNTPAGDLNSAHTAVFGRGSFSLELKVYELLQRSQHGQQQHCHRCRSDGRRGQGDVGRQRPALHQTLDLEPENHPGRQRRSR